VLDSNAFTYWDSQGLLSQTGPSQSITIDMGAPQVVSSLIYEPRQGASPVGAIGRFEVSVSTDGIHFETVSTGTWANTTAIKQIGIAAVTTRFVRLTALSTASGSGSDIAAAEIYLRHPARGSIGIRRRQGGRLEHIGIRRRQVGRLEHIGIRRRQVGRLEHIGI
jgi:hypothetical protein